MGNQCIELCYVLSKTLRGGNNNQKKNNKQYGNTFIFGALQLTEDQQKLQRKKKAGSEKLQQIEQMEEPEVERKLKQELVRIRSQQQIQNQQKLSDNYKQIIYDFNRLQKDELLRNIMGYGTTTMINEKQCEPSNFFALKQSDELLWEDHSEYLQNIILDQIIYIDEQENYKTMIWEGKKLQNFQQQYIIEITQLQTSKYLKRFENNFYFNKQIQQVLQLIQLQSISHDLHNISYQLGLFLLHYSNVFIRIQEKPIATLKDIIKIRQKMPNNQGMYNEKEVLGFIIHIIKALKEAKAVYINHGFINDENIYLNNEGIYKLKGFNELRLVRYKVQTKYERENSDSNNFSEKSSELNQSSEIDTQYNIACTLSYLKYYIHQVKPRSLLFCNNQIGQLIIQGLQQRKKEDYNLQEVKIPKEKLQRDNDEIFISSTLMSQNMYSLAIIAIQMITLGQFEKWVYNKINNCEDNSPLKNKENSEDDQNYDFKEAELTTKFIKSFCGLNTKNKYFQKQQINLEDYNQYLFNNLDQMQTYENILLYLRQYLDEMNQRVYFQTVYAYIEEMLKPNCDWKKIIDQLYDSDYSPPKDLKFFEEYRYLIKQNNKSQTDKIIQYEEKKNELNIRAFNLINSFETERNYFYQVLGYLLIRNTKVGLEAAKQIIKDIDSIKILDIKLLKQYNLNNKQNLFFTNTEFVFIKFCLGVFYLQNRQLELSYQTFRQIENDISQQDAKSLKKINLYNIKFYLGIVLFISGEAEEAIQLFDIIMDMSKNNLKEMNEQAYYQFLHYYFLIQLDQDGYFEAFRYIEEINQYYQSQFYKLQYINKNLVVSIYNKGKAYYEVSQFQLSKFYFEISLKLIQKMTRTGSEMDSLRLMNLGYLGRLCFLQNDMENMKQHIQRAIGLMSESITTQHCLQTIVIWLNLFGFLLKVLFNDLNDMISQTELFEVSIENNQVKIDLFLKKFVIGKMYYYSGSIEKAQGCFLDALQLQSGFVAEKLRNKQFISAYQKREFQLEKIHMLNEYQYQQKKFKTTLPPPSKDNLTVRILMEVLDWLGFLYGQQNEQEKAQFCFDLYEEYMNNLFKFEKTLIDEYTFRWAQIQFYLKNYEKSLELFQQLSLLLKKQQIDEDLYFEYQIMQSNLNRWIGTLYLLLNLPIQAQQSILRSKEELLKLYKKEEVNECFQIEPIVINSNLSSKLPTQQQEDIGSKYTIKLDQTLEINEFTKINQIKQTKKQYLKLQQSPILTLLVQNAICIIWDYIAMDLKESALQYVEEFFKFIEKEEYLKNQIFVNELSPSLRSDIYFLIGYLNGLRGQHEETFLFFQRSYNIIKEHFKNNQTDQQLIQKMSLINDQMSRVLAHQGFFIHAKLYLTESLNLQQQLKTKLHPLPLAYKHANLGNLLFQLGELEEAEKHTRSAMKIFQERYGLVSVVVLQVRTKLLQILLINSGSRAINKATLQLIETFKQVSETNYSIKLDGEIQRMIGSYYHKYGKYEEALNSYVQAFIKLLDNNDQVNMLLTQWEKSDKQISQYLLNVRVSDRASLDVALKICQLYIDNLQHEQAIPLLLRLFEFSKGIPYVPRNLDNLFIFGLDKDEEIHTNLDGVLKVITCFHKVQGKTNQTIFEYRRNKIMEKLKTRRHIDLLFIANIYKLLGKIVNHFELQKFEPYFFQNYIQLLHFNYDSQQQKDNNQQIINKYSKKIFKYLQDALIIYQEAVGDFHTFFSEALYLLIERQYINEESEDIIQQIQAVIGIVKQQKLRFPLKVWRLQLIEIKTQLLNCKIYKQLMFILNRFSLDPNITQQKSKEKRLGQKSIIKLLKNEEQEFSIFLEELESLTSEEFQARYQELSLKVFNNIEFVSNYKINLKKTKLQIIDKKDKSKQKQRKINKKNLFPQYTRDLFSGLDKLKNLKKVIEKYEKKKNLKEYAGQQTVQGQHHKKKIRREGNVEIIKHEISIIYLEINLLEEIIINILGKEYVDDKQNYELD